MDQTEESKATSSVVEDNQVPAATTPEVQTMASQVPANSEVSEREVELATQLKQSQESELAILKGIVSDQKKKISKQKNKLEAQKVKFAAKLEAQKVKIAAKKEKGAMYKAKLIQYKEGKAELKATIEAKSAEICELKGTRQPQKVLRADGSPFGEQGLDLVSEAPDQSSAERAENLAKEKALLKKQVKKAKEMNVRLTQELEKETKAHLQSKKVLQTEIEKLEAELSGPSLPLIVTVDDLSTVLQQGTEFSMLEDFIKQMMVSVLADSQSMKLDGCQKMRKALEIKTEKVIGVASLESSRQWNAVEMDADSVIQIEVKRCLSVIFWTKSI